MEIIPLPGIVHLKIEKARAGVLDVSSRDTAVEFAEVISVGEGVSNLKKGDKVFVKAWGIDITTHNNETYYFCAISTNAILAIVHEEKKD